MLAGAVRAVRKQLRQVPAFRRAVVRARHIGLSKDDAFVVAYPKSGSTWLSGMLAHMATGTEFSFDTHGALTPGVGTHRKARHLLPNGGRLLRSHERVQPGITDRYGRVVYMVRDGRDIVVSWFHHYEREEKSIGTFDQFFEAFLAGDIEGWGAWPAHVRGWLGSRQAIDERLLTVRYEDVVARPVEELGRIAAFLGLEVPRATLEQTAELHTIERMQEAERRSRFHARQPRKDVLFVRRGSPGEFREVLSPAQRRRFDEIAGAELERLGYPRATE
jgi:hypothetical protein